MGSLGRWMMRDDKSLTYTIIGAAMEIHRRLGPWHPERVYHRALKAPLDAAGWRRVSHLSQVNGNGRMKREVLWLSPRTARALDARLPLLHLMQGVTA